MTDEQINEIVQISETIRNCYLNAIERTDADREYRQGQRNIAKWLEELKRYKEMQYVRSQKWIDVNEALPDENIRVLVTGMSKYDNKRYTDVDTDRILNDKWVRWNGIITHWMPLPKLPKPQ